MATQRDVLDMEQQSDEIKAQVSELKKTVSSLQANQADLSVKIDQVHSDLSSFVETMKDSQSAMGRLSDKMDDLEAALGQKVSGLGEAISKQQTQLEAKIQETDAKATRAQKEAEMLAAVQREAASALKPSQLFHSARIQLSKKQYALAAQGFETYLHKYPKGSVADAATYYLGECQYGQKSWEAAARQYALVLERFPKSERIPAARLKYAVCLMNLQRNPEEAKRYLQSIPEDFPKSPEAAAARKLLQRRGSSAAPKSDNP